MPIYTWRGDAQGSACVWHVVPSSVEAGDKFTLTINRKSRTITALAATVASVVNQFVELFGSTSAADESPEWAEIAASAGVNRDGAITHLILSGPSKTGRPFTLTASTGDAGNLAVKTTVLQEGSAGANTVQRVALAGAVTGGTFTLTSGTDTTAAIAYNATAAAVQSALTALASIGAGNAVVAGSAGGPWDVTFQGALANQIVSLLVGNGASLSQGSSAYAVDVTVMEKGRAGQNEKQTITLSSGAAGGTFTLEYAGAATAALPYNATAAAIQTALTGLATVGAGNAAVSGNAGGPWTVEFVGGLARKDTTTISGSGANLTGCAMVGAATKTKGTPPANTIWKIVSYWRETDVDGQTTVTIGLGQGGSRLVVLRPYYSADDAKNAFEQQIGLGNAAVRRTIEGGNVCFCVEFCGAYAGQSVALFRGINCISVIQTQEATTGINAVQSLAVTAATGGTYILAFKGQASAAIAYNATAAVVQTALEGVSTIGAGNALVTETARTSSGVFYTVEFRAACGSIDQPLLVGNAASLTGGQVYVATSQEFVSDVAGRQRLTILGVPQGGAFTLSYSGQTTAAIPYNATAAAVKTALDALSTIDTTAVTGMDGGPWNVEFTGTHLGTIPAKMAGSGASLTGAAVSVAQMQAPALPVNEQQSIELLGSPSGGTFTLAYGGQTSTPIPFNATAVQVQIALQSLSTIGSGAVSVSGQPAGPWTVFFCGALGSQNTSTITGSAASLTSAGTQGFAATQIAVGTGPEWFSEPLNWDLGAVPGDGDTILFAESSISCLYGLGQSAITPALIRIDATYTGAIGLPRQTSGAYEYRDRFLRIGNAADARTMQIEIGRGDGSGSPRVQIDTGDCPVNLVVHRTGSTLDNDPAVQWKGMSASSVITVHKGSLGSALGIGETSHLGTLNIDYANNRETDAEVILGDGCRVGTITKIGGTLIVGGCSGTAVGTIHHSGGEATIRGTDGCGQLNHRGGLVRWCATGALGGNTLLSGDAVLDFSREQAAKSVANPIRVYGDLASVLDPFGTVPNLRVDWVETTRLAGLGNNIRLTRGAIA